MAACVQLRPSSLGEILDRTAQMYRSHFLLYFGIAWFRTPRCLSSVGLRPRDVFAYTRRCGAAAGPNHGDSRISIAYSPRCRLPLPWRLSCMRWHETLGHTCTIPEVYTNIGRRWYRYILILLA